MNDMGRDAGALIRSLLALRGDRRTGALDVEAEGTTARIYLIEGSVVYAEETPPGEPLGRLLVHWGQLTPDQYTHVIKLMADAGSNTQQLRFGVLAVESGFITEEQLDRGLLDQVKLRIAKMLHREDHEWKLNEGRENVDGVPLFDLPIEPLVLLAARSFPDDPQRELIPAASMARFPVLADELESIANRFALRPGERAFVGAIDGSMRISDLLPATTEERIRTHQRAIVAALLWTRAVKLGDKPAQKSRPEAEPAPPSVRNIPVVQPRPRAAAPVPAPKLELGPAKVTKEARLNAELAFQKGKAHLRAKRPDEALVEFRVARDLDPSSPEFELYERWFGGGAGEQAIDDATRLAIKRCALLLSRTNPSLAFPLFVIGRITILEGHESDAKRWLERALKVDPDLHEAERALHSLKGR